MMVRTEWLTVSDKQADSGRLQCWSSLPETQTPGGDTWLPPLAHPSRQEVQITQALVRYETVWGGGASETHQIPGREWGENIVLSSRYWHLIQIKVKLAEDFAALVQADERFQLPVPPKLGLVCFRLRASNVVNETLNKRINDAGKIHITPSKIRDTYILRFAVCSRFTMETDIQLAWEEILNQVGQMEVNK